MTPFEELEFRRKQAGSSYTDIKKHWVRLNGWLPVFKKYSDARTKQVKYLTLCAKKAIDIRYFRHKNVLIHDNEEKKFPTVTFIEKESQDFATIAETLGTPLLGIKRGLEDVFLLPEAFPEDHQALLKTFPYDIVNLDFTGDVVPTRDHPYSNTLRAIEKIFSVQHEKGAHEWHMFLTFRACRATSNEDANIQIRDRVADNLADLGFKKAYGQRSSPQMMLDEDYKEFLRIGIPKYLAWRATDNGFSMNLENSYFYPRKGPPPYDILKFIIGFKSLWEPGGLPDRKAAQINYRKSVESLFASQGINVFAKLSTAAERKRVQDDLNPVLDELREDGLGD